MSMKDHLKRHMGFKSAQHSIANTVNPHTGKKYGEKTAGAILAASSRHASASAHAKNPRLNRVAAGGKVSHPQGGGYNSAGGYE